jgi:hypothetical protein
VWGRSNATEPPVPALKDLHHRSVPQSTPANICRCANNVPNHLLQEAIAHYAVDEEVALSLETA